MKKKLFLVFTTFIVLAVSLTACKESASGNRVRPEITEAIPWNSASQTIKDCDMASGMVQYQDKIVYVDGAYTVEELVEDFNRNEERMYWPSYAEDIGTYYETGFQSFLGGEARNTCKETLQSGEYVGCEYSFTNHFVDADAPIKICTVSSIDVPGDGIDMFFAGGFHAYHDGTQLEDVISYWKKQGLKESKLGKHKLGTYTLVRRYVDRTPWFYNAYLQSATNSDAVLLYEYMFSSEGELDRVKLRVVSKDEYKKINFEEAYQ